MAPRKPKPAVVHRFEKKKKPASPPKASAKAPAEKVAKDTLPFEIDPQQLEKSLQGLRDTVVKWAKKGRYTKVRFKFRGKQLLPDLPLAAVAAFEGLTFYWTGLLRLLVFNLAGNTVLDVQLVNDSEKKVQEGKEALLSGELDTALALFREAQDMDRDNATVQLNLGIALKLKGQLLEAAQALQKAQALDAEGPVGAEASRLLQGMKSAAQQPPPAS